MARAGCFFTVRCQCVLLLDDVDWLLTCMTVARRGYAEVFSRKKPHMNIGTVGA